MFKFLIADRSKPSTMRTETLEVSPIALETSSEEKSPYIQTYIGVTHFLLTHGSPPILKGALKSTMNVLSTTCSKTFAKYYASSSFKDSCSRSDLSLIDCFSVLKGFLRERVVLYRDLLSQRRRQSTRHPHTGTHVQGYESSPSPLGCSSTSGSPF